jgi:predicted PurR-regulated permease PerM
MAQVQLSPPSPPNEPRISRAPDSSAGADAPVMRVKSKSLGLLLLIAVLSVLYFARALFIPLTFAVMLFFLLRPCVRWLVERRVPRPLASALVLASVLGTLGIATLELAGPAVAWSQRLPSAVRQIELKSQGLRYPVEHLTRAIQAVTKLTEVGRSDGVPRVDVVKPGWLEGILAQAASIATELLLTVVAAFFFLIDGDALLGRLFRLTPEQPGRKRATVVMNEVGVRMSAYLGAVTLVNLGLGVALTSILFVLGMPNPWLWGGLAAVLTYVPYLGPAVGIMLVTAASFVTFPTASSALAPPLAYLGLASLEGNFVTPLVLGRTFAVRPLVIFVWLALWAWLWGVPGAILAVPMLMLFKFVCDETPGLAAVTYVIRK